MTRYEESFGDIAIFFSQQLCIIIGTKKMISFGGFPSKSIDAIRFRDVLYKGY